MSIVGLSLFIIPPGKQFIFDPTQWKVFAKFSRFVGLAGTKASFNKHDCDGRARPLMADVWFLERRSPWRARIYLLLSYESILWNYAFPNWLDGRFASRRVFHIQPITMLFLAHEFPCSQNKFKFLIKHPCRFSSKLISIVAVHSLKRVVALCCRQEDDDGCENMNFKNERPVTHKICKTKILRRNLIYVSLYYITTAFINFDQSSWISVQGYKNVRMVFFKFQRLTPCWVRNSRSVRPKPCIYNK